jgi:hypothetical protein
MLAQMLSVVVQIGNTHCGIYEYDTWVVGGDDDIWLLAGCEEYR